MKARCAKLVRIGLAWVLALVFLAGCGVAQGSSAAGLPASGASTAQPSAAGQGASVAPSQSNTAFPLTVTDHLGRQVTIDKAPEKLVSGYYITTSLLIALGQAGKLVGVEAKAERFPVYGLAAPHILDLPNVGSAKEFDLEGCAALAPDLVILPAKLADAITALEALGIPAIGVDPEDRQRLLETIAMVGAATGSAQRAEELGAYIRAGYSKLEALTQGLERPTLYFAGNSAYLKTAGEKMYQNSLIEAAGAENVAAGITDSYWAEVSYEQLVAWAPQVIVVAPGADYTVQALREDTALAGLEAVRQNRVLQMPSQVELWDAPVPSSILGSLWLASQLHPQAYSAADFSADFSDFYRSFYGIEVAYSPDAPA